MAKLKVAIYTRVSTQEQAQEGYSIGEQQERLQMYAKAQGWIVYKVYTDAGYSGASTERPALTEMIQDASFNKFNKVLVYKLDRLSRRQRDTLYLIEDIFIPRNIDFVSMTENFDTGSSLGRAMIGIMSVFAQLEREQIKERMQLGLDARAKKGLYNLGGTPPIGYDYDHSKMELVVNEFEAMQIKKIFELYGEGWSIDMLVDYLNSKGYKHKYGEWIPSTVSRAIKNKVYLGLVEWKGEYYDGVHEAIITQEQFDKTTKVNEFKIKKHNPKNFKSTTLLAGILYCKHCGGRFSCNTVMPTKTNKIKRQYYMCYSRIGKHKHMIKDPNCRNRTFNVLKLDAMIIEEVKKLNFDNVDDMSPTNSSDDNEAIINNKLNELDKQIAKLIELYAIQDLDFNMINSKIEALNNQKKQLQQELLSQDKQVPNLSIEEAKSLKEEFDEVVASNDKDRLRMIIHTLIEGIYIDNDDITIKWRFV